MFSEDKDVMANYMSMYGNLDFKLNYHNLDIADNPKAKQAFDEIRKKYEDGSIKVSDYTQAKGYNLIHVIRPSLDQNLDYFFYVSEWLLFRLIFTLELCRMPE